MSNLEIVYNVSLPSILVIVGEVRYSVQLVTRISVVIPSLYLISQ